MGCVDEDGQLMRAQLAQLTKELYEARSSEAESLDWLQARATPHCVVTLKT